MIPHSMLLIQSHRLKSSQLSQAIGKNGQNVRLASTLIGWKIKIISEETDLKRKKEDLELRRKQFTDALDIDQDVAELLIKEGFNTLEEIAYVESNELLNVDN